MFLLAGGPPCQGFSVQRRGSDIDPRNDLVLKYGQMINELFPMYFVMENVSGIAGKRGKTILQQLIEYVEEIGYSVHIALLDAQDYGVPQRRKRYIIVGERKDMGENYTYPQSLNIHRTVRDAIGFLPVPPENGTDHPDISLHRRDRLSELNLQRIRAIKEGQGRDNLPSELLADCHKIDSSVIGFRSVYGRMAWDEVAPTITARFDSFTRGKFGHPEQDRSISLREICLILIMKIFSIKYQEALDWNIADLLPKIRMMRKTKNLLFVTKIVELKLVFIVLLHFKTLQFQVIMSLRIVGLNFILTDTLIVSLLVKILRNCLISSIE